LRCPGLSSADRSPAPKDASSFRIERAPLQSCLTTSQPSGLSTELDSHEVSAPFDELTRASPVMKRVVRSAPVPLSGFLNPSAVCAGSSSTALFRAAAVLGLLAPSELSPRKNRAPLSGPLAPLPFSTRVQERATRGLVSGGFAQLRRASAPSPGSPVAYDLPFGEPEPTSRSVWTSSGGDRPLPRASSTSKPCSSCESVRSGLGCPAPEAAALLEFRPSRDSASKPSEPQTRPNL
jgi:hypothetical protein